MATDDTRKAIDISYSVETTLLGAIRIVGGFMRTVWDFLFFPAYFQIPTSISTPTARKDLEYVRPLTYAVLSILLIWAVTFAAYMFSGLFDPNDPFGSTASPPAQRLEQLIKESPAIGWIVTAITELETSKVLTLIFPYLLSVAGMAVLITWSAATYRAKIEFVESLAVCCYGIGTFNVIGTGLFGIQIVLMSGLANAQDSATSADMARYAIGSVLLTFLWFVLFILLLKQFFHHLRLTMKVSRKRVLVIFATPLIFLSVVGNGFIWLLDSN